MCSDNHHRTCCLEAHAALDANDGIAHVNVTTDAPGSSDSLYSLDCSHLVVEVLAVHAAYLALVKSEGHKFLSFLGRVLEESLLGQTLPGVENLTAADRGAPETYVVRILKFRKISKIAICIEVIHLFLAAEVAVTGEGYDFHIRTHHEEGHIEAYLIVAGTSGTVRNGVCANAVGITGNGYALENPFRRNGNGIATVAEHIAVNHILETLFVVLFGNVESNVLLCTKPVGIFFIGLELLGAESAGVCTRGINLVTLFLCKIHHRVGGIKPAAERDNNFFLLIHFAEFCFLRLTCLPDNESPDAP